MKNKALQLLASAAATLCTGAAAQDVEAGYKKAAMCIGCHSLPYYQASFPEIHKVPMISGQNARFIAASLNAYKKGERKHPTMRAIAGSLSDADIADLSAFYEQHGKSSVVTVADAPGVKPAAEVGALLARGACASCHGANYNKPIDASYPKLSGQHADYLYVALKAYQVEGNPQVGRANAIMAAQVKQFKPSELKLMAAYLAALPGDLKTVPQPRFK